MRARLPAAGLLVAASLADLPVVYVLVRAGDPSALVAGFVSMGLAWAAGFHVQDKRLRLVQGLAVIGILQAAAALLPGFAEVRAWLLAGAALSAAALAATTLRRS